MGESAQPTHFVTAIPGILAFVGRHATCSWPAVPSTNTRAVSVLSTGLAFPNHRYRQEDLVALAKQVLADPRLDEKQLERLFRRVNVRERHLALSKNAYAKLNGMATRSRAWLEVGLELGQRCIERALQNANLQASDIGYLMTTTVTGLCVPTLDARLMNRLPFASTLKRNPCFGLGCVGGAAGVARVADYLRAFPDQAALLLSVELCSLTVQPDDLSTANMIAMGLFGDGAASVLMVGPEHPKRDLASPRVVDSRSVFFPGTERVMGWDIIDTGFKIVLDSSVPEVARNRLPPAVNEFLAGHGLAPGDIKAWVCHPGGPKVMDAVAEGLGLDSAAVQPARDELARIGNLSSASVLILLDQYRNARRPPPGSYGVMLAMGPAFCAELVLLQW